jgi:hypothetical protein
MLIKRQLATCPAEFVVQITNEAFVFVWPNSGGLLSGEFYQVSNKIQAMMPFFQVDTLANFLKNN